MYRISRQTENEERGFVEIYHGEFIGNAALKPKYPAEFVGFDDPREAVEKAILIRGQWQAEENDMSIGYGFGSTIDKRMARRATRSAENLRLWALDTVRRFPVCGWCEQIIYTPDNIYSYPEHPGVVFCCGAHGVAWLDAMNAADEAIVEMQAKLQDAADREEQQAEEVTRRDVEFAEEHRQNV